MKKTLTLALLLLLVLATAFAFSSCDEGQEEDDTTLYKLNIKVTGYDAPVTVTGAAFPEDEEGELVETPFSVSVNGNAAYVGEYLYQTRIDLSAPKIEGYKFMGWYDENGQLCGLPSDFDYWNMTQRDCVVEARYQKWTYNVSFRFLEDDENNPNTVTKYCPIDDAGVTLLPATTTNAHKHFERWEYWTAKEVNGENVTEWVPLTTLPKDFTEDCIDVQAVFVYDTYNITFAFEEEVDPETTNVLDYATACESITLKGNLTTINGEPVLCEFGSEPVGVTPDDEIRTTYGSWIDMFFVPKEGYRFFYCKLNGERFDYSMPEDGKTHIAFDGGDITEDTVITFVLSDAIPE